MLRLPPIDVMAVGAEAEDGAAVLKYDALVRRAITGSAHAGDGDDRLDVTVPRDALVALVEAARIDPPGGLGGDSPGSMAIVPVPAVGPERVRDVEVAQGALGAVLAGSPVRVLPLLNGPVVEAVAAAIRTPVRHGALNSSFTDPTTGG